MDKKSLVRIGVGAGLVALSVAVLVLAKRFGLPEEAGAAALVMIGVGLFLLRPPGGGGDSGSSTPLVVAPILFFVGATSALSGCTPQGRRDAGHAAIDAAGFACVLANAFLDIPAIKVACRIEDALDDQLHTIVDAARTRAKMGVPLCAADGGVCLPSESMDAGADR